MKTAHLDNCERVFSRYDMDCPRCRELAAGAKPKIGWDGGRETREYAAFRVALAAIDKKYAKLVN